MKNLADVAGLLLVLYVVMWQGYCGWVMGYVAELLLVLYVVKKRKKKVTADQL